ncbi:RluA family pseudouridine synthase [Candidatus Saccharibacteria bacterium]|nr:RluA family pseudouridine synthase [Candidatus Saccharibacteria bacterium]
MRWTKKQAIDFLWRFGQLPEQIVDDEKLTGLRQIDGSAGPASITEFKFAPDTGSPIVYWALDLSQDNSPDLEAAALGQVQKIAPGSRLQFVKIAEDRGKTLALVQSFPQSRLDALVAERFGLSRAAAKSKIESGKVQIDGQAATKPSREYDIDGKIDLLPEPELKNTLDLPILYQDEDVIVIDKPSGILSHSKGQPNDEETVATWLAARNPKTSSSGRSGIVHRLDRGTSGVMILAKNPVAEAFLQKQFAERKVKKTYLAIIEGEPKESEFVLDLPIARNFRRPTTFLVSQNGKPAQTHVKVAQTAPMKLHSLLELRPTTGRTHQLRVHLAYLNHPILGDTTYGGKKAPRIMLHASELELTLPNSQRRSFKSKTPLEFTQYV